MADFDLNETQRNKAATTGALRGGATGGLSGAATGASIGAAIGGPAAPITALLGGILGFVIGAGSGAALEGTQAAAADKAAQKSAWRQGEAMRKARIDSAAAARQQVGTTQLNRSTTSALADYVPTSTASQYGAWRSSTYGA